MPIYVFKSNLTTTSSVSGTLTSRPSTLRPLNEDGSYPVVFNSTADLKLARTTFISVFLNSLGITWKPSTTYSFVVSDGFVTDDSGGTNVQQTLYLTTPSSGPTYQSIAVNNNASFTLTFDRAVYTNAGNLSLYKSNGTLVRTISAKLGKVTGSSVTYFIAGSLVAGQAYYVTIPGNCFIDSFLLPNSAVIANQASFTVVTEPTFHGLAANLSSSTRLTCSALKFHGFANLTATSALTAVIGKIQKASSTLSSNFNLTTISNNLYFQINVPTINYTVNFSITSAVFLTSTVRSYTVYWGDGNFNVYNISGTGNLTCNPSYTYSNIGYYNIIVQCHFDAIQSLVLPAGIVTKIYDWGQWNTQTNLGGLMFNQRMLTNVPNYLPGGSNGNYQSLCYHCEQLNDPNVKNWFPASTIIQTNTFSSQNPKPTLFYQNPVKWDSYSMGFSSIISDYSWDLLTIGTMDFWFYNASNFTNNVDDVIFSFGQLSITYNPFTLSLKVKIGTSIIGTYTFANKNNWHHIAIGIDFCQGNGIKVYLDGTSIANQLNPLAYISRYSRITLGGIYSGYFDEFRISNNLTITSSNTIPLGLPLAAYSFVGLKFENSLFNDAPPMNSISVNSYTGLFQYMFFDCYAFNQDLSSWNLTVTNYQNAIDYDRGCINWSLSYRPTIEGSSGPLPTPVLTFLIPITATVSQNHTLSNPVTSTCSGGNYGSISYTSLDTSIATVDNNGLVIGIKPGTTTITAYQTSSPNYNYSSDIYSYTLIVIS